MKRSLINDIKRQKYIYLMIFIPLVFYTVFKYIPLWNAQIAFRNFKSVRYGILNGLSLFCVGSLDIRG